MKVSLLHKICRRLATLHHADYPQHEHLCLVNHLTAMHVHVHEPERGSVGAGSRDVLLLKLWATVFPVSDRRHPVTTPLALLTSSYLALCRITCHQDAAIGGLHWSCDKDYHMRHFATNSVRAQ